MQNQQRGKVILKTTIIGSLIDLLLTVLKLLVGSVAQSAALIADGLHSLSDLATDLMLLVVAKFSSQEADSDHPYGHQRFETIATALLGGILLVVAAGILYDSIIKFWQPNQENSAAGLALCVAGLSLLLKEWLFRYTLKKAIITESTMLKANAWHSRSDSLSSLVVFIGILLNFMGLYWAEIIAAAFISLVIAKMGLGLFWNALQDLADRSVDVKLVEDFKKTIYKIEGVKDIHQLRTRRMANKIFLDTHIQVSNAISVSEGHQISDWVVQLLKAHHSELDDITIHIDHEDDAPFTSPKLAPLRSSIEQQLALYNISHYQRLDLHYHGLTQVELHFYMQEINDDNIEKIKQLASDTPYISGVQFFQEIQ